MIPVSRPAWTSSRQCWTSLRQWVFALLLLAAQALVPAWTHAAPGKILVFGDSLSAAYGIGQKEGWVALLEARLRERKSEYSVVNASISGETSAGGASRIASVLAEHKPQVVVLELGANDGLRGLPIAQMRDNLAAIIRASRGAGARVVVVGMRMPPNYGPQYTREFQDAFGALAREHKAALVPFLFEGFAGERDAFQPDGLHPVAASQPRMLDNVWQVLAPMIGLPAGTGSAKSAKK